MPQLSIVIVNYNAKEDLRRCLASLLNTQLLPDGTFPEIIVVDNASSDGSAAMVKQEFPIIKLIEPNKNTWFCGGNNLGSQAATGDYVLLLNPDTVVPPDALFTLMDFITKHPEYAGVTLQLRYPNGEIQRTCSRAPSYHYLLLTQTVYGFLRPNAKKEAETHHWYAGWERDRDFDVAAVPGSCTLVKREDAHLDENLLLYFPEDDLAKRFDGRLFRFIASPSIEHREKSVTRTARASSIYFRDLIAYTHKHHGVARAVLMWVLSRPLHWGIQLRWLRRKPN